MDTANQNREELIKREVTDPNDRIFIPDYIEPTPLFDLSVAAFENSRAHGFWQSDTRTDGTIAINCIPTKLCLIHAEVSEALEEYRTPGVDIRDYQIINGKPEGFGVELADVLIRMFDLCGAFGIDLDKLVAMKMEYNASRPFRHGDKRA